MKVGFTTLICLYAASWVFLIIANKSRHKSNMSSGKKRHNKLKRHSRHVNSHLHIYFQSDPKDSGMSEQESPKVALQTQMVAQIKEKKCQR